MIKFAGIAAIVCSGVAAVVRLLTVVINMIELSNYDVLGLKYFLDTAMYLTVDFAQFVAIALIGFALLEVNRRNQHQKTNQSII